jgi:hypothetical protein
MDNQELHNESVENETPRDESLQRVIDDVWKNALSLIQSDLGRLAYLNSLRDPNSGQYHHYGLETVYSAEESDEALRHTHLRLFYEWLKKPLAEQKEDVEFFLRTVEGDPQTVLENWKVLEPYRTYVPIDADPAGRQLFADDITIIVELLWRGLFWPGRQPTA